MLSDYIHHLIGLLLIMDLLECNAVLPRLRLGVHLVNLEVDLYSKFSDLRYYLGFLLFNFRWD
jgi:hypothetical protein